jgi:hypothetical protein
MPVSPTPVRRARSCLIFWKQLGHLQVFVQGPGLELDDTDPDQSVARCRANSTTRSGPEPIPHLTILANNLARAAARLKTLRGDLAIGGIRRQDIKLGRDQEAGTRSCVLDRAPAETRDGFVSGHLLICLAVAKFLHPPIEGSRLCLANLLLPAISATLESSAAYQSPKSPSR